MPAEALNTISSRWKKMNKRWSDSAWDDYLYWQSQDKKILKKINELIKDIERNGVAEGIGKPVESTSGG